MATQTKTNAANEAPMTPRKRAALQRESRKRQQIERLQRVELKPLDEDVVEAQPLQQLKKGSWLQIRVDDVTRTRAQQLVVAGVAPSISELVRHLIALRYAQQQIDDQKGGPLSQTKTS